MPGTEQASNPFFSPDGESVAFFTVNQLKTVGFSGELPRVVADIGGAPGLVGAWDRDGRIFFGRNGPFGLSRVPAVGGEPEPFAELGGYLDLDYPDVLPGGEWVLFTGDIDASDWSSSDIVAQNVTTGERKVVFKGGRFARYLPTGHLVFVRDATLYAVAFDAERLEVIGPPVPVVQDVAGSEQSGVAQFVVASNGTLVYGPGQAVGDTGQSALVRVDLEGKVSPLATELRRYANPRVSPDGSRVAVEVTEADARTHIWIMDLTTDAATQLTFEGENRYPVWMPDGQEVLFTSTRDDLFSIYRKAADGTGEAMRVLDGTDRLVATDVLPGNVLVFQDQGEAGGRDILTVDLDGDGPATPFLATPADERSARASPNGAWIVYLSDESGPNRVYIRPYPSTGGGQRSVSQELSAGPVWSRTGEALYFIGGPPSAPLTSVPVAVTATTVTPGKPRELFGFADGFEFGSFLDAAPYDVMPNGDGFIAVRPSAPTTPEDSEPVTPRSTIKVVLNWAEELKRLVPTP